MHACGSIAATRDSVIRDIVTHGKKYHQYGNIDECLSLSTWKRFVLSSRQFMATPWTQQHADPYLLWAGWKKMPCSPTTS
jgi:hypothetical protein